MDYCTELDGSKATAPPTRLHDGLSRGRFPFADFVNALRALTLSAFRTSSAFELASLYLAWEHLISYITSSSSTCYQPLKSSSELQLERESAISRHL